MTARSAGLVRAPWLPLAWLLLFFVSELKWTKRSATEAAQGVPSLDNLIELGCFLAIGAAALATVLRLGRRRRRSMGVRLLLCFGSLALCSALWSRIPLFSAVRAAQILAIGLLALASRELWLRGRRDLETDWRLIWAGFTAVVLALAASAWIRPSPEFETFAWQGMHRGTAGHYLALLVIVMFCAATHARGAGSRTWVRVVLLAVAILFLLLNVTRSSIAAGLASLLLVFATADRQRWIGRSCLVVMTAALVGPLLLDSVDAIATYLLRGQTLEEFSSLTGRAKLWAFSRSLIEQQPLLGHGYGAGRVLLPRGFAWAGHAHNLWIEAALGLGLVGCTVVSSWLAWIWWGAVSQRRRESNLVTGLCLGVATQVVLIGVAAPSVVAPGLPLCAAGLITAVLSVRRESWLRVPARATAPEPAGALRRSVRDQQRSGEDHPPGCMSRSPRRGSATRSTPLPLGRRSRA
jgi:O-antigen ligase